MEMIKMVKIANVYKDKKNQTYFFKITVKDHVTGDRKQVLRRGFPTQTLCYEAMEEFKISYYLKNKIDEKLDKDFYGIIITQDYFDITGKGKIYGALYSSFDNVREERNLTFKKSVIANLDNKFSIWQEIPYSRNVLKND